MKYRIPPERNPKDIPLERVENFVNYLGEITDTTPEGASEGTVDFVSGMGSDAFFYSKEAALALNISFSDMKFIFPHCLEDIDFVYVGFEPYLENERGTEDV